MQRVRPWLVATCAAVALTSAACTGGSSPKGGAASGPAADVLSAVQASARAEALTTTIRLDSTPATLQALAHAANATLTPPDAKALKDASIVIETARTGSKGASDTRVLEGGRTLFELRGTSDTLYLQADVRGILTLVHKRKVFADLRAATKSMPGFVQAALNGHWVSLPTAALASLAQAGGSGSAGSSGSGTRLLNDLHDVIKRDATVSVAGSDSRGQHYVISGDEQVLAGDLSSAIADAVPGGAFLGQRIPTAHAAHRTIHVDAWVKGGSLAAFSLDLAQFGDPGTVPAGTTVPLVVGFEQSGAPIEAPSGAVPVDLTQLGTLVGALSGGGT